MTDAEPILVEIDDHVATVTLNKPDKLNAIDLEMDGLLFRKLHELEADEDVRVIVVTGAGRAFCAGVDLSGANPFDQDAHSAHDDQLGTSSDTIDERAGLWRFRTPVIGAINGAAVGAGLTLACLFDLNIVAEEAKLGFVFSRRGILPDANIHWFLPRVVGTQRALELLMTGRTFRGSEAAEMGLALKAVPADQVLKEALSLAREIATASAPSVVGLTKRLVYRGLTQTDVGKSLRDETTLVWHMGTQPDAMEGVMSFMEKREPNWKVSKHVEVPEGIDLTV